MRGWGRIIMRRRGGPIGKGWEGFCSCRKGWGKNRGYYCGFTITGTIGKSSARDNMIVYRRGRGKYTTDHRKIKCPYLISNIDIRTLFILFNCTRLFRRLLFRGRMGF